MKSEKTFWVASTALSAVIVSLCLVSGCGEKEPEVPSSAPESYMKDPVFMNTLKAQYKERNQLLQKRCEIDAQLQAEKAKNPDSPRVKELQAALDAADAEFEKNRQKTNAYVAERLRPKKSNNAK